MILLNGWAASLRHLHALLHGNLFLVGHHPYTLAAHQGMGFMDKNESCCPPADLQEQWISINNDATLVCINRVISPHAEYISATLLQGLQPIALANAPGTFRCASSPALVRHALFKKAIIYKNSDHKHGIGIVPELGRQYPKIMR